MLFLYIHNSLFLGYEKQEYLERGGQEETKEVHKTGSKQQGGTKERMKSLLAPKPTAGQPPDLPHPGPGDEQHLCALAAKRSVNLYKAPLHTSMIVCIFRWFQWQMNVSPVISCWAADEMSAGAQGNYHVTLAQSSRRKISNVWSSRKWENTTKSISATVVVYFLVNMPKKLINKLSRRKYIKNWSRIYGCVKLFVPKNGSPCIFQTLCSSSEILDAYHKFLQHRYKNLQAVVWKAIGNGFSNLHAVSANRQYRS